MKDTVSRLFEEGLLCDLHVGYFRAMKKLSPKDIGLSLDDLPEELYSMGRRRLLPPKAINAFKAIESQATRFLVPPYAFSFPITSSAKFVPIDQMMRVESHLESVRGSFISAVEDFQEVYPDERRKMMRSWESHLWKLAQKVKPEGERTEWVETTLKILEKLYPNEDAIPHSFRFVWDWYPVSLPSAGNFDKATATAEARVRAQALEKYRAEADAKVYSFMGEVISAQRKAAVELVEKWAKYLSSGESIHHMKVRELRDFISRFREGNFLRDHVMQSKLDQLEAVLPATNQSISDTEAKRRIASAMANVSQVTTSALTTTKVVVDEFLGRNVSSADEEA